MAPAITLRGGIADAYASSDARPPLVPAPALGYLHKYDGKARRATAADFHWVATAPRPLDPSNDRGGRQPGRTRASRWGALPQPRGCARRDSVLGTGRREARCRAGTSAAPSAEPVRDSGKGSWVGALTSG